LHECERPFDALEHGKLDLAFTVLPMRPGPFESVVLYREEHVVVCARTHPLARRGRASLEDLEELQLIAVESAPLEGARRLDDVPSLLAFVSAGLGVGFVPSLAVTELPPELVALRIDARVPPRVIALAWHAERRLQPRAVRFVELAAAAGRTLRRPLLRAS
jgi:DNA-binding transcriptional LysR family regulator